jgi:hypothetical protein
MSLGSKVLPVLRADKLTVICKPIVRKMWVVLDISQPYRPPRPVTGIALLLYQATWLRRPPLWSSGQYLMMC